MIVVKGNLKIILAFAIFTSLSWSQESSRLIVTKDFIVITKPMESSTKPTVYKGQLLESELQRSTPILGKTDLSKKSVRFIPLIPFTWEQEYTVIYNNVLDYFKINIPEDYKQLSVEAVYPSAKELPSNLLKWHIQFSKPINQVNVYNHLYFVDHSGDTLSRAILPLENALISEDQRLLTVWIDPGRQKRGLIPNQQLGPVFEEGKEYFLIVTKNLKDQEGIPMKQNRVHKFTIIKADREQPNIDLWKIHTPLVDTISDLTIDLKESIDYSSALSRITIMNSEKKEIYGDVKLIDNESILVFKPQYAWKKGHYQILIDPRIEDLAGNSLTRLFDSEIKDTLPEDVNSAPHSLTFSIKQTP